MQRRSLLVVCCAIAAAIGPASAALAQGDDPDVDPGSPAGTEYQLPIDRARAEAGGGGSTGSPEGPQQTPLFGEGVERTAPSAGSSSRPPSDGTSSPPAASSGTGGKRDPGTATPEAVRSQAPTPEAGSGTALAIGGSAAGVLLIGALGGLTLRRRASRN